MHKRFERFYNMKGSQFSIKTIASKLDVSPSTVSHCINGKAIKFRISNITAETISKTTGVLNYAPNLLAKALHINNTVHVKAKLTCTAIPFFFKIGERIEKHRTVVICNSEENPLVEKQSINMLIKRKTEELIISLSTNFNIRPNYLQTGFTSVKQSLVKFGYTAYTTLIGEFGFNRTFNPEGAFTR